MAQIKRTKTNVILFGLSVLFLVAGVLRQAGALPSLPVTFSINGAPVAVRAVNYPTGTTVTNGVLAVPTVSNLSGVTDPPLKGNATTISHLGVSDGGITNNLLANPSITISGSGGLTGGGSTALGGTVTLTIHDGGVTNAKLANPSLTVSGAGALTGGGTVALGSSTTITVHDGGIGPTQLANTSVTPSTYGSGGALVGSFTADAQGRITGATNVTIAIPESAVASLTSDLVAKAALAGATFTGPITAYNGGDAITSGNYTVWLKSGITMSGSASGTTIDSTNALTAGDNALKLLNAGAAFVRVGLRGTPAGAGVASTTPGIYSPQTATPFAIMALNSGGYDTGMELNRGGDACFRLWSNGTNYITAGIADFSPVSHDNAVTLGAAGSAWQSITAYTVVSQHHKGSGTAPTGVLGTGANQGAGSSITIVGNDTAGTVEIHTGSGAPLSAVMATITFNATYTAAPSAIILSAANDVTASDELGTAFKAFATTITATTFVVTSATAGVPQVSTTYKWFYHVLG